MSVPFSLPSDQTRLKLRFFPHNARNAFSTGYKMQTAVTISMVKVLLNLPDIKQLKLREGPSVLSMAAAGRKLPSNPEADAPTVGNLRGSEIRKKK